MSLLLINLIILLMPAALIPVLIKKGGYTAYRMVMYTTLAITVGSTLVFMMASMTGHSVFGQLEDMIDALSKELASNSSFYDSLGMAEMGEGERINTIGSMYKSIFSVMPAVIIMTGAISAYLQYMLISSIIRKKMPGAPKLPPFREFSWPASAFMGVMGMYLISWLLTEIGLLGNSMVYMNMDLIFEFVFAIQGLSVLLMFCHMKRVPKAAAAALAVLAWLFAKLILLLAGMFDLMFGLKRKITGRKPRV